MFLAGMVIGLLAGFVQGLTGFAFVLAFAPLMLWFGGPRSVVVTAVTLGIPLSLLVVLETRHHLSGRRGLVVVPIGALAVPLGTWIFASLPSHTLRLVVAGTAFLFSAIWFLYQPSPRPQRAEGWMITAAALAGGLLNASTGMGGPPLALVAAVQQWDPAFSRGVLAAFNLSTYVLALLGVAATKVVDPTVVTMAIKWLPAALIGCWLGSVVARRLSVHRFAPVLILTVGISAVMALLSLWREP